MQKSPPKALLQRIKSMRTYCVHNSNSTYILAAGCNWDLSHPISNCKSRSKCRFSFSLTDQVTSRLKWPLNLNWCLYFEHIVQFHRKICLLLVPSHNYETCHYFIPLKHSTYPIRPSDHITSFLNQILAKLHERNTGPHLVQLSWLGNHQERCGSGPDATTRFPCISNEGRL